MPNRRQCWCGESAYAAIDDLHLDIYLPLESQLGGKLRIKVEVLAEYPSKLAFKKWTLSTFTSCPQGSVRCSSSSATSSSCRRRSRDY